MSVPFATPAGVIFDFDGTIADTEWPIYEAARVAHEEYGLSLPVEEWVTIVGSADNKPLADRLTDRLGHPPDEAVLARAREQHRVAREEAPMLPGVAATIDAVAAASVPLAVASSSTLDWVDGHLARLALRDRFAAVRTRDHVDRGKPAPDLFLAAAAALGLDPSEVLVIEDSRNGCVGAKAAGMTCVVVPNRITRHDVPADADLVLDSLVDFPFADFGLGGPR